MDYTKQLLLSMILNVCTQLSPDGKPVKPGLYFSVFLRGFVLTNNRMTIFYLLYSTSLRKFTCLICYNVFLSFANFAYHFFPMHTISTVKIFELTFARFKTIKTRLSLVFKPSKLI